MSGQSCGKRKAIWACCVLVAAILVAGCEPSSEPPASPAPVSSSAPSVALPPPAAPRFTDDTKAVGLEFVNGRGKCIALGDINADGWIDVYACAVYDKDRFYVNKGDGTFRNETDSIQPLGDGHGAVFVDLNNDGHSDLFVACNPESGSKPPVQPNRLYLGPEMKDVAKAAGVEGKLIAPVGKPEAPKLNRSCGVAIGDIDNDGDLDMYVAKGAYEYGYPNSLFENRSKDGVLQFVDIAKQAGVDDLGAITNLNGGYVSAFADFDDDGLLDLFIGNIDLSNKDVGLRLFRNKGDGTFADVSKASGVTGPGMVVACAVGDVDNDGDLDLFVTFGNGDAVKRSSALFINDGRFKFREVSQKAGIVEQLSARGCTLGDVNNDGYLDILVAELWGGKLYINQRDGTFREQSKEAGIKNQGMHGCTFADMDNDGDLDFYSTNWYMAQFKESGRYLFFRNGQNDKNWLKVLVKGTDSNRSAVGARVSVYDAGHAGDKAHLLGFREVAAGSGVFTSPPLVQHFGLRAGKKYDVVVYFPTTKRKVVSRGVATAQAITITEPAK